MIPKQGVLIMACVLFACGLAWAQDVKDGPGQVSYADGRQYTGEFKNGLFDGQGVLTYADGSKYEGGFKEGQLSGDGLITYADGTQYKGKFKDGDVYTDPATNASNSTVSP